MCLLGCYYCYIIPEKHFKYIIAENIRMAVSTGGT